MLCNDQEVIGRSDAALLRREQQSWKGMAPISAVSIAARETGVRPLPPVSVARFGAGRIAPGRDAAPTPRQVSKPEKSAGKPTLKALAPAWSPVA